MSDEPEVTVVEEVQRRVRKQTLHDPGVDHRNDRIVASRLHQDGLPDQRQERQARPSGARCELEQVAATRTDPRRFVQEALRDFGTRAQLAAVKRRSDSGCLLGIAVTVALSLRSSRCPILRSPDRRTTMC